MVDVVNIHTQLAHGIEAAKNGDRKKACNLLYAVLDKDPRNEMAWVWLSYAVDSLEDRQICLENVLTLNPTSQYALRGLAQIKQLATKQADRSTDAQIRDQSGSRSLPLVLTIAFWAGLGVLFLIVGIADIINWGFELVKSRTFPYYITPTQLWTLSITIAFLILSILVFNVAWALFIRHKIGYFASIVLALSLILAGPTAILISDNPVYILAVFAAVMPTIVLFLTLMSQMEFNYEQGLAPYPKRN
jgi:hypothetical protein